LLTFPTTGSSVLSDSLPTNYTKQNIEVSTEQKGEKKKDEYPMTQVNFCYTDQSKFNIIMVKLPKCIA